jgi:hypothetical protein
MNTDRQTVSSNQALFAIRIDPRASVACLHSLPRMIGTGTVIVSLPGELR